MSYYVHGRTPLDDYLDYYNYNTTSSYDATPISSGGTSMPSYDATPTSSGGTSMPASSPIHVSGPSISDSYSTPTQYPIPSENYLFSRGYSAENGRTTRKTTPKIPALQCPHKGCIYQTRHKYDLNTHTKTNYPSQSPENFDSPTLDNIFPHLSLSDGPEYQLFGHQNYDLPRKTSRGSTTQLKYCLYDGCKYQTKRQYDLDRHQKTHFPSQTSEKFDCPGRGCGRTGKDGFDRKDHFREHLRKVHAQDIPRRKPVRRH